MQIAIGPRAPVAGIVWRSDEEVLTANVGEAGWRRITVGNIGEPVDKSLSTGSSTALTFTVYDVAALGGDRIAVMSGDCRLLVCAADTGAILNATRVDTMTRSLVASRDGTRLHWAEHRVPGDWSAMTWDLVHPPVRANASMHSFEADACLALGPGSDVWTFCEWDVLVCDSTSGALRAHYEGERDQCLRDAFVAADGAHAIGIVCRLNRDDDPIHPHLRRWDPRAQYSVAYAVRVERDGPLIGSRSTRWCIHGSWQTITRYASADGRVLDRVCEIPAELGEARVLRLSPDERHLAIGTESGAVIVVALPSIAL